MSSVSQVGTSSSAVPTPSQGAPTAKNTWQKVARITARVTLIAISIFSGIVFAMTGNPIPLVVCVITGVAALIPWSSSAPRRPVQGIANVATPILVPTPAPVPIPIAMNTLRPAPLVNMGPSLSPVQGNTRTQVGSGLPAVIPVVPVAHSAPLVNMGPSPTTSTLGESRVQVDSGLPAVIPAAPFVTGYVAPRATPTHAVPRQAPTRTPTPRVNLPRPDLDRHTTVGSRAPAAPTTPMSGESRVPIQRKKR